MFFDIIKIIFILAIVYLFSFAWYSFIIMVGAAWGAAISLVFFIAGVIMRMKA